MVRSNRTRLKYRVPGTWNLVLDTETRDTYSTTNPCCTPSRTASVRLAAPSLA
jgi:hypothetical protein